MRFLTAGLLVLLLAPTFTMAQPTLRDRVEGLILGSLIGDAAGGPWEFQPPQRSRWTRTDTVLTAAGRAALADRFALKAYPKTAEPYAQWTDYAPPGTVTDDSRFKWLFVQMLAEEATLSNEAFARTLLRFHADTTGPGGPLRQAWLDEFAYAARWILGDREHGRPPERSWGGIPTMAGQMPFLLVAALHPGDPEQAYRTTWALDFLDNGYGKDVTAALVAGLAAALADGATWATIEQTIRTVDPYGFGEVPWVPRRVTQWLDVADRAAAEAEGRPARLYRILERDLNAVTWWEAWVPPVVVFAGADLAAYDPLASMQLVLEFGHDTDSYLQVLGAYLGALHGKQVFPEAMRRQVRERMRQEYGVALDDWLTHLGY